MCFSWELLKDFFIWAIVVVAVVMILQLLANAVLPKLGGILGEAVGVVAQIIKIVLWAIVLLFIVYFAFDMIACLVGHMPALGHVGR